MGRGPHKPTALRALEGGRSNSLQKPEDINEPKPAPVNPDPPKELGTQAKKIWKDLAPKLSKLGLLTEADVLAFTVVCHEAALIRFCLKELKEPEMFKSLENLEKEAKTIEIYRASVANLYKFAKEFGMTPRGRVGLVVGGGGERGAGADLLT